MNEFRNINTLLYHIKNQCFTLEQLKRADKTLSRYKLGNNYKKNLKNNKNETNS